MRAIIPALAALALAACGGSEPAENKSGPQIKIANPGHDELTALPPDLQRLGVMRAIRGTRNRCRRVESARYQQDHDNMAMWVALCSEGRHWAIFIAPNRDVQVRDCAQAHELGLPQCRPVSTTPAPVTKSGS